MIEYLIESVICSSILYLSYLFFFRRSRNYHVNRVILLFSVCFFLTAPLFHVSINELLASEVIENTSLTNTISGFATVSNQTIALTEDTYKAINFPNLIMLLYVAITAILLGRFCLNIYPLVSGKLVTESVSYKGQKIALVDFKVSPFSFFNTIYVNKEVFNRGKIDHDLLLHESGHIRQLHSVDIVFLELVHVFHWFNPFVLLFKKLIRINHEYLADEYAINSGSDKVEYSNKLISYSATEKTLNLVSGFNYSSIKNRLIMISKHDQQSRIFYPLVLFFSMVVVLFATTAFSNPENMNAELRHGEEKGFFYADSLLWSGADQKVYLKGKVQVVHGENNFKGNGRFSFLGKVSLLIIDGRPATLNSSIQLSGKKCEIITLSKEAAQQKYGLDGSSGAVEIKIPK